MHQAKVSGEATLNIYEINYPPIPMQTFKQNLNNMEEENSKYTLWYITGGIVFLILTGASIVFLKKRRNSHTCQENLENTAQEQTDYTVTKLDINDIPISPTIPEFHNYDLSKSVYASLVVSK